MMLVLMPFHPSLQKGRPPLAAPSLPWHPFDVSMNTAPDLPAVRPFPISSPSATPHVHVHYFLQRTRVQRTELKGTLPYAPVASVWRGRWPTGEALQTNEPPPPPSTQPHSCCSRLATNRARFFTSLCPISPSTGTRRSSTSPSPKRCGDRDLLFSGSPFQIKVKNTSSSARIHSTSPLISLSNSWNNTEQHLENSQRSSYCNNM